MSAMDTAAIAKIDREQILEAVKGALEGALVVAPQAREKLESAWNQVHQLVALHHDTEAKLRQAAHVLTMQVEVISELTNQRDAVADELSQVINAVKQNNVLDMPAHLKSLLLELNETMREDYNESFWASLPYDIAQAFGNGMSHTEAEDLYALLTLTDEDIPNSDWTFETVERFREGVLKLLREVE